MLWRYKRTSQNERLKTDLAINIIICKDHSLNKITLQPLQASHTQASAPVSWEQSLQTLHRSTTFCTLECEMHSLQNTWLQLIFTAVRSRNRTTITNRTFVPHDITSFPEWIGTRRPTDRSTAKIHRLKTCEKCLEDDIFELLKFFKNQQKYHLLTRLLTELWMQWKCNIYILVVFVLIGYRKFPNFHTHGFTHGCFHLNKCWFSVSRNSK